MGVVLDDSPGERVLLYGADGTVLRKVVVDSSGHLQVDALSSALPSGAATEAKQDTQITALQLIDDLRNDLAAVATDKLRTSVIDSALPSGAATEATLSTINTNLISELTRLCKLYGYDGAAWQTLLVESAANPNLRVGLWDGARRAQVYDGATEPMGTSDQGVETIARLYALASDGWRRLRMDGAYHLYVNQYGVPGAERQSNLTAAAGSNTLTSTAVPSAKVWLVTSLYAFNDNTVSSRIRFGATVGGTTRLLHCVASPAAGVGISWQGHLYLPAAATVGADFFDCLLNDDLYLDVHYIVRDA